MKVLDARGSPREAISRIRVYDAPRRAASTRRDSRAIKRLAPRARAKPPVFPRERFRDRRRMPGRRMRGARRLVDGAPHAEEDKRRPSGLATPKTGLVAVARQQGICCRSSSGGGRPPSISIKCRADAPPRATCVRKDVIYIEARVSRDPGLHRAELVQLCLSPKSEEEAVC